MVLFPDFSIGVPHFEMTNIDRFFMTRAPSRNNNLDA